MIEVTRAIEALVAGGPIGLVVAGVLVGGAVVVIVFARSQQLFSNAKIDASVAEFQASIVAELERSREREKQRAEQLLAVQVQLALYREATALMIAQLRLLAAGRITAGDISIPELPK